MMIQAVNLSLLTSDLSPALFSILTPVIKADES